MSLEKANISWSAKQLKNMISRGKVDFDHIVQRSYVWERKRKSALIESLILGYPIPPIFAKRSPDGKNSVYSIMDGKQRLSTVAQYLEDKFALTDLPPVTYYDEVDGEQCEVNVSGMKFSELPEPLQDILSSAMFTVIYFDNLSKSEERELFKRLNAGKPLSTKSRLLASCNNIDLLLNIGSHALFDEMLTDKARDNKNEVSIVMKVWCMMNKPINEISFESKAFNPLFETVNITDEQRDAMDEVFSLIHDTHSALLEKGEKKIAKKLYTETNFVSLIPFFKEAVEASRDSEIMAEWLCEFFTTDPRVASISEEYNDAVRNGSAKNANIVIRHEALDESYNVHIGRFI